VNVGAHIRFPHLRWNSIAFLIDYATFGAAFALVSVETVVPSLADQLTGSALVIGLVSTVFNAAWLLPQLAVAHAIKDKPSKKPYILPGIIGRGVALLLVTLALWLGLTRHPVAMLGAIFLYLALFAVSDGVVAVSWFDILARTVPVKSRGRLLGIGQALSGLAGVGAGVLIGRILGAPGISFPTNYALLFTVAAVLLVPSSVAIMLLRESPSEPVAQDGEAAEKGNWFKLLADDRAFRRVIICRILVAMVGLTSPFYVVHASAVLRLPSQIIGAFVVAQTLGGLIASLAFGSLAARKGPLIVIRIGSALAALGPLLALLADLAGGGLMAIAYPAVFVASGAANSIWTLGFFNYVLEIAPDDLRPVYVGAGNTIMGIMTLRTVFGGWLLGSTSYAALFAVTIALVGAGFLMALTLKPSTAVTADDP